MWGWVAGHSVFKKRSSACSSRKIKSAATHTVAADLGHLPVQWCWHHSMFPFGCCQENLEVKPCSTAGSLMRESCNVPLLTAGEEGARLLTYLSAVTCACSTPWKGGKKRGDRWNSALTNKPAVSGFAHWQLNQPPPPKKNIHSRPLSLSRPGGVEMSAPRLPHTHSHGVNKLKPPQVW